MSRGANPWSALKILILSSAASERLPFWSGLQAFWLRFSHFGSRHVLERWFVSFCCRVFLLMPRGWSRVPDGWWQRSLRPPRPPSEVWPRAQQFRQPGLPQPPPRGKGMGRVRSLEVALSIGFRRCCGEDGSRSRIAACQGGTEVSGSAPSSSVDPTQFWKPGPRCNVSRKR